MLLPIIASPNDVLQVVQFLKTRAIGCTLEDAKVVIDKKLLDHRKINAYIIWGLVYRDGDKLKLSELGKRLARVSETEYPDIFSSVIRSINPYHSALEWAFYQKDINSITNVDIASFWYENKKFSLDSENENTLKDMAVCYFKVCMAAGIGILTIGRRGQQTRLDLDRNQLGQYIGGSSLIPTAKDDEIATIAEHPGIESESSPASPLSSLKDSLNKTEPNAPSSQADALPALDVPIRIFISHGKNMEIVEQIKTLIELANLDYEIVVETETAAIPIPEKVFGAMRRCNSAVICVSADENDKKEDGSYDINRNVLIEIGSAFVLYDKKVILVWDKRIAIPTNLQGLYRCEYTGDELSWGPGIKLMKALNGFKRL
ncbi:MAG: nucleotide-binding protein [Eubacteriales bacterium]|nr:nucleotide-binding protein [Eubacteriales bacterium]